MIQHWQKIALIFLLLLTGCATIPKSPVPITGAPLSWQQHYQQLVHIKHWYIKGAIGIQYGTQSNIASLIWQQQNQAYDVKISGPLNLGAIRIAGGPGSVSLWRSKQVFTATSPEALMQAQLGWQLPLADLAYWVRGIPNPKQPAKIQVDDTHHAIQIVQQNWLIQYLGFSTVKNIDLPNKIILSNPRLHVKLVIKQWQI